MKTRIFSSLLVVLMLSVYAFDTHAQDNKVYDHVSLNPPPTYPGGIRKFYDFLGANLKYPKVAVEKNIQGTLYLTFTVEKDGSLTDIKTEGRKLGYGTEEEAIRVLKLAKKWNPGQLAGKPVRTQYNLPIKFALPNKTSKASTSTSSSKTAQTALKANKDYVYDHVSMGNPPLYPGGLAKFYAFLGKNISYPRLASENKVKGNVYVSFTIEKDGSVTDVTVEGKKLGAGTDEEAVRVVKLSQKWKPGMIDGQPVRTKYNIPIKFTM